MAALVGGASLGAASAQPVSYHYRRPSLGKPTIAYDPKSGPARTSVAQGTDETKLSASFEFRPPPRPPGSGGIGERGSFADVQA